MADAHDLDRTDARILEFLRVNARLSAAAIGESVDLSSSAVRKRIARLERSGVIAGYTVKLDHDKLDSLIEAYVELSFAGDIDVHSVLADAIKRPEIREAMTLAGEPDALIRLRVTNLTELRNIVIALRTTGAITASKTMIVLGRWWHGSVSDDDTAIELLASRDRESAPSY